MDIFILMFIPININASLKCFGPLQKSTTLFFEVKNTIRVGCGYSIA